MHFSNYVCVCFKFAVDLSVMETKEIANGKIATAVIVSVVLLPFITMHHHCYSSYLRFYSKKAQTERQ